MEREGARERTNCRLSTKKPKGRQESCSMTPHSIIAGAVWHGNSDLGRSGPTVLGARNECWCGGCQGWRCLRAVLVSTKSPPSLAPPCRASCPRHQAGAAVRALPSPGAPHCTGQTFQGVKSWNSVKDGRVDIGAHGGDGSRPRRSCRGSRKGGAGAAACAFEAPSHASCCASLGRLQDNGPWELRLQ